MEMRATTGLTMDTQQNPIDVSIIIPARNEAKGIRQCLTSILSQKTSYHYEIILIDSGSTDGTVVIAKEFPITLIEIKPEEFGHGKSRALGGRLAKGNILVFTTADAYPARNDWLDTLCSDLNDPVVAGVYSRWIPKQGCNPLVQARIYAESLR